MPKMVNVARRKFPNWQEALSFAQQKLNDGCGNIRIITAKSQRAKSYGIIGDEVQVRYW
jgi:hypothetical protein